MWKLGVPVLQLVLTQKLALPWSSPGIWGCREAEGQLQGYLCGADIPIWRNLPSSPSWCGQGGSRLTRLGFQESLCLPVA